MHSHTGVEHQGDASVPTQPYTTPAPTWAGILAFDLRWERNLIFA